MNKKVFISGSISIKRLPKEALKSIDKIISKKFEIILSIDFKASFGSLFIEIEPEIKTFLFIYPPLKSVFT